MVRTVSHSFQHESLADIREQDIVRHLMLDAHWRQRLIGLHGIPEDVVDYLEVPLDSLKLKGDIDILLVPPSRPEYSTAIQVKRIKVSANGFETGKPNKLSELSKLMEQANPLAEIGFWQVYCFVLVVVDSRNNNGGTFNYAGLTSALREKIENAISIDGLAPRVGLIHFEFVQPIDDRPLGAGTYFARPKRMAQTAMQPEEVTAWVQHMIQPA